VKVDVILPAYNERDNIQAAIAEVHSVFSGLVEEHRVIVVDDGSMDGTDELLRTLAMRDRKLQVVRHRKNRGYGAALRSGFKEASSEWVFFTDSDRQFDLAEFRLLLEKAPCADIVSGYRALRRDPFLRVLLAFIFNLATRTFLSVSVRDTNCAFKLIRSDVLERIVLESEGALINAELLIKAARLGARIVEVPVTHRPRLAGRATGSDSRVVFRAIGEFARLFIRTFVFSIFR
jgi:glycosyltransferase involved in cell wall biosynthesis